MYDHIRGLSPWPVGYGLIEGKKLKLIKAFKIIEDHHDPIGQFVAYEKGLKIACDGGYVVVTQCQAEGKEKMEASAFYNGLGKSFLNRNFK
ncbi:MAG: Methionyl-tRNA formyltransferase [Erysipelotrichaceae bacterium]|nr:MAG: Methionyl-tRNA formyltransferase [Erysipelotrichaceae bacterium]